MITRKTLANEFSMLCKAMGWNTDPANGDHYILSVQNMGDGKARYEVELVDQHNGGRHQPFGYGSTWVGAKAADLALRTAIDTARLLSS